METMESFFTPRDQYFGTYSLKSGLLVALLISALGLAQPVQAAEFTCASGDVACLIDAINQANANGEANRITLRRGTYTLTAVDNGSGEDTNGLPVITSSLTIRGQGAETTIIERDTGAPFFRILSVAAAGTVTLQRLTLRNGLAFLFGVGGGVINGGTLSLIDCILTRNNAAVGGGLFNGGAGTVTITHTTFDGNGARFFGGGLVNSEGTVTIANSTFVRNGAENGGGILNGFGSQQSSMATVTLTNTTVAQNAMNGQGGAGIENVGVAVLQSTTVAENHVRGSGAGVVNRGTGTVLLQNTIIARNDIFPPGVDSDCSGPVTSLGNNLIGNPTGFGPIVCTITLQPSDLTGDPGLDTFTDSGKPGNGHFPLLSTSQAIDAGNNAVCLRRDQLGKRRVGPCDIGAISFRDKDDSRDEEDLVSGVQGSR
jgi:hypothetical protein